jgi:hypothetical protein
MPAVKKTSVKDEKFNNVIVTAEVKNYSDESFFIEKEQKAKDFLSKHPLPDRLKK